MGQNDQVKHRACKAKRKLDLDNTEEANSAKKQSANTAVQITQYAAKRPKVNKEVNSPKSAKTSKKGGNKTQQNLALAEGVSDKESHGENNNTVPWEIRAGGSRIKSKVVRAEKSVRNISDQSMQEEQVVVPPGDAKARNGSITSEPTEFDLNKSYDGVYVGVDDNEDDFADEELSEGEDGGEDEVFIKTRPEPQLEEIPPEVIEQLKNNPTLKEYFGELVEASVDARMKSLEKTLKSKGKKLPNDGNPMADHETNRIKSPSDTTIYRPALA